MTWVLSASSSLLLRTVAPLIRRALPHLAMAAMATLVCGTALAAGHGRTAVPRAAHRAVATRYEKRAYIHLDTVTLAALTTSLRT
ncbi:hypothetical protein OG373_04050 [Streptomyces avidinii]|uniref:hypothetical protein n=1 Tax=Streptomyces avidinii TaxID=1895 RepID=UPI00386D6828|nr:hypothetical protein OG592_04205 [Streptomyces avidinii]WTA95607.1 hypothetical protein OG373_04050 [Streptomyces avidinii]